MMTEKVDMSQEKSSFETNNEKSQLKMVVEESSMNLVPLETDQSQMTSFERQAHSSSARPKSVNSCQSRASLSPYRQTTTYGASKLFSYKPGVIESAVEVCKSAIIDAEKDGVVTGSWLLADIDHWDLEREKLIVLTTNSLIIAKFDFISSALKYYKRIALKDINSVDIGDLSYPAYSVMSNREYGGLRIHWSKEDPWFYQRWNPWCEDVGFTTLTHHLLIYNEKERETATYNVSDFADSLIQAVNESFRRVCQSDQLPVREGPITIFSYASVTSVIYNQSHIGYNMDRGGVTY